MNLDNNGKLNTNERIGFFDIRAIEARLTALTEGKFLVVNHCYYGEVVISMNPQKNRMFFYNKMPEDFTGSPEGWVLWGFAEGWQAIDEYDLKRQLRIKELEKELSLLKSK